MDIVEKLRAEYDPLFREAADEIEQWRAALRDLFLLACASQDIRPDAEQMKAAGQLLAAVEQSSEESK